MKLDNLVPTSHIILDIHRELIFIKFAKSPDQDIIQELNKEFNNTPGFSFGSGTIPEHKNLKTDPDMPTLFSAGFTEHYDGNEVAKIIAEILASHGLNSKINP